MARHLKFGAWCILAVVTLTLIACGGGGGGGGGAALNLTGTVSDSTQQPVSGATVAAYNASTGKLVAQATTNAVGRYSFYGLRINTAMIIKVTGPAGTFPAQAENVTLASGAATVLDFYLPSSGTATESAPGVWQSQAEIHGPRRAVVSNFTNLSATPTAVTVAPFDVSLIGDGYPVYSVFPLQVGVDEIIEFYAAAAFSVSGATFTSANLYMPVPLVLDIAAAAAVAPALYRFDTATSAWVAEATITPTLTVDPVNGTPAFLATVTQAGYYRVGKAVPATPVTGTLTYSDGKPAAGVTVHVTGSVLPVTANAYGYQQVLVTDKLGQYNALVKTGGNTSYMFTTWGFGVELSQSSATPSATLAFDKPIPGVPATATLTLDDPGILPNWGTDSIGLIVASGRLSSDADVINGTVLSPARADVSFNVSSFDGTISLNGTTKESGIQVLTGSFGARASVPATGYDSYIPNADPLLVHFPAPVVLYDPNAVQPVTLPILVAVKTSAGYAKISIDSVTETAPNSGDWVIEFRSAFSLSGSF